MKDTIDLTGASGANYRFQLFRDGRPLSPMGGNYLYVREEPFGGGFTVLYVGEGENLLTGAPSRWAEAETDGHATHLFTRLNISQMIRKHEYRDLIAGYQPQMNPEVQIERQSERTASEKLLAERAAAETEKGRQTVSGGPEAARDRPEA